jgi:hypothetical protein
MIPELVSRVDYYQGPYFFADVQHFVRRGGPRARITKNSRYNAGR